MAASEITFVGFNGPDPFSIIVWQHNGIDKTKTICYTSADEKQALERFFTKGDFYNHYHKAIVVYKNNTFMEYEHLQQKLA